MSAAGPTDGLFINCCAGWALSNGGVQEEEEKKEVNLLAKSRSSAGGVSQPQKIKKNGIGPFKKPLVRTTVVCLRIRTHGRHSTLPSPPAESVFKLPDGEENRRSGCETVAAFSVTTRMVQKTGAKLKK